MAQYTLIFILLNTVIAIEGKVWIPPSGTTWQWQLSGTLDASVDVTVYDVDLFETTSQQVKELHDKGRKVFCYISVGSYEKDRPDSAEFPSNVIGLVYPGWENEKFIDTRSSKVREIMAKRFDLCKSKGFDGIEPDNIDTYGEKTGFPLNENTAVDYAHWMAGEAHSRNLSIGQKNAPEITPKLVNLFDWALTESCAKSGENWCSEMKPYTDHNKAIFAAEYDDEGFNKACVLRSTLKLSPLRKHLNLDKWYHACT